MNLSAIGAPPPAPATPAGANGASTGDDGFSRILHGPLPPGTYFAAVAELGGNATLRRYTLALDVTLVAAP